MTTREIYKLVLETISKEQVGSFTIYEVLDIPSFLNDKSKYRELEGNYIFPYELTEKATEKDYDDYINYVLNYTGQDLSNYILDKKEFKNFRKGE